MPIVVVSVSPEEGFCAGTSQPCAHRKVFLAQAVQTRPLPSPGSVDGGLLVLEQLHPDKENAYLQ